VVADGMGGHNAGDIASRLATTSLRNFYEATENAPVPPDALGSDYDALAEHARRLAAAIQKANRDVIEISSTYRQHHGMGSTVVAAYLERQGGLMHVGHVGDSRCYRMRDGKLELLTHDHSLINDALALKPDLTPEELSRLPKNIITRALGMREEVKVDIRSEAVRAGDIFLLCSDGLSGMISEADIATVLRDSGDLREACELLVTLANDNGGTDNITALLVRINADDGSDTESASSNTRAVAPSAPTPPEPPKAPKLPAAKNDASVFLGKSDAETAKLSEILPDSLRASLEAGEEVSLTGSFADTVVDTSPPQSSPKPAPRPAGAAPAASARASSPPAKSPASPVRSPSNPKVPAPLAARPAAAKPAAAKPPASEGDGPLLEIDGFFEESTADAARSQIAHCKKCDAELEVGNLFCVECGTRISDA
jgi:protein phosphatase